MLRCATMTNGLECAALRGRWSDRWRFYDFRADADRPWVVFLATFFRQGLPAAMASGPCDRPSASLARRISRRRNWWQLSSSSGGLVASPM